LDPERWRQIDVLYQAALDLPETERAAFLSQACGADRELLRQVEEMLASDARAGNFLESPAVEAAARILATKRRANGEDPEPPGPAQPSIAHYRIVEKIGGGGMGVVYKAQDIRLGRFAALKFISESVAHDTLTLKRFEREARIASALDHPHICTIYEIGEDQGRLFIAMQYLEGESLKRRIERKPLSSEELFEFAIQITGALSAAHAKGVIHRDIKPANIFISVSPVGRTGAVKVLDFGIAKLTGSDEADARDSESGVAADANPHQLTRAGMTMGTAAYMSPEQARGETLDFRTDLFSFGALLYEMATGRQAFAAPTTALTHEAVLNREPPLPSSLYPKLPAGFDAVVSKALEKDRELRCQSAAELRADLMRLKRDAASTAAADAASGTPSQGMPVSAVPTPAGGRKRWIWAAAALIPVILALAWYASSPRTPARRVVERQLTASFGPPVLDAALSPDGSLLAYANSGGLHLKVIDTGEVFELPSPAGSSIYQVSWFPTNHSLLLSVTPGPGLRTELWAASVFGGEPRLIRRDVRDASVSPDGSSIAFTTNAQDAIWVMNAAGEQARRLVSIGPAYSLADPAWLPGSRTVVYLLIGRMASEIPLQSMARSSGEVFFQSFDLDTGRPGPFRTASGVGGEFSILRDGGLVYLGSSQGIAGLYEITDSGKAMPPGDHPRLLHPLAGAPAYRLTAAADGKRFAIVRRVSELGVFVAGLTDGGKRIEEIRRLKLSGSDNSFHAWAPDGRAVLFSSNRDGVEHIFEQALDRPEEERLVASEPGAVTGRFTPDGKWLLYKVVERNGEVRMMRMAASGGQPQLLVNDRRLKNYFCSAMPANFCVVSFAEQNQLIFRRLDPSAEPPSAGFAAAQLSELARTDYNPTDWAVSPDGLTLAMVRPDAQEARIHILSLKGGPSSDVIVKGWTALQTLNWARGGNGWYVSSRMMANGISRIPAPFAYVDRSGTPTLLNAPDTFMPSWGIPSPNGRYFAFAGAPGTVNVWLIEGF